VRRSREKKRLDLLSVLFLKLMCDRMVNGNTRYIIHNTYDTQNTCATQNANNNRYNTYNRYSIILIHHSQNSHQPLPTLSFFFNPYLLYGILAVVVASSFLLLWLSSFVLFFVVVFLFH